MTNEQLHCGTSTGALNDAWHLQVHAARQGFDWQDIRDVFAKVQEELEEVRRAHRSGDVPHARAELGDLLFACVNLARFLDAQPEEALRSANVKFSDRFEKLVRNCAGSGRPLHSRTLAELDAIWEQIKQAESSNSGPPVPPDAQSNT